MAYNIPDALRSILRSSGGPHGGLLVVDVDSQAATEDGTWKFPYKSIQAAIDEVPESSAFDTPAILVMTGVYDEHLTIPGDRVVSIISLGAVLLGTLGSPKNVTWTITEVGDNQDPSNINAFHLSSLAGNFFISGNLVISDGGNDFECQVNFTNVFVVGNVDGTGAVGEIDFEAVKTNFNGTFNVPSGVLSVQDCFFNGLATFERISRCAGNWWDGGITLGVDGGHFLTSTIRETFTGPANSYRVDEITDYQSNAVVLAGGATKVILTNYTKELFTDGVEFINAMRFEPVSDLAQWGINPASGGLREWTALNTTQCVAGLSLPARADDDETYGITSIKVYYTVAGGGVLDVSAELLRWTNGTPPGTQSLAFTYDAAHDTADERGNEGHHELTMTFEDPVTAIGGMDGFILRINADDSGGDNNATVQIRGALVQFERQ